MNISTPTNSRVCIGLFVVLVAGLGYFGYQWREEQRTLSMVSDEKALLEERYASTSAELDAARSTIASLEMALDDLNERYSILTEDYVAERGRNEDFNDQIRTISKTVGVLDKLSKTDEELLQKYSKVYFLNEHYTPEKLSRIPDEFSYDESRTHELHSSVMPFFTRMVEEAKEDGVELWVVSAFRSFETQAQLKGQYLVTYGSGANTFSADQGFSEHQLGTAVDFTTRNLGGGLTGFQNTEAYAWLLDNAHRYGFTLSYPEGNAFYVFEPWHWRFVGVDLARDLKRADAHFYDWEQRKIDEYLISIFD